MSEKISGYTSLGRDPIDTDLFDTSADLGGSFGTRKVTGAEMKEYFKSYAWYEEGTLKPPTTINDDIYTNGNVGISMDNTDTITAKLHVKTDGIDSSLTIDDTFNVDSKGHKNLIYSNATLNGAFKVFKQLNASSYYNILSSTIDPLHFKFSRSTEFHIHIKGTQRNPNGTNIIDIVAVGRTLSSGVFIYNSVVDNSTNAFDAISFYTATDTNPVLKIEPNNYTVDVGSIMISVDLTLNFFSDAISVVTDLISSATNI